VARNKSGLWAAAPRTLILQKICGGMIRWELSLNRFLEWDQKSIPDMGAEGFIHLGLQSQRNKKMEQPKVLRKQAPCNTQESQDPRDSRSTGPRYINIQK
jgi:hypothetical protein